MEDLGQNSHLFVGLEPWDAFEEAGHFGLPAAVYFGFGHAAAGFIEIIRLEVADEQTVFAEEERVVVPTGR